jgi:hypothetical protein
LATPFEEFVNLELPKRVWIEVPVTGNLDPNQYLITTGVGLGVYCATSGGGAGATLSGISPIIVGFDAGLWTVGYNSFYESVKVTSNNQSIFILSAVPPVGIDVFYDGYLLNRGTYNIINNILTYTGYAQFAIGHAITVET